MDKHGGRRATDRGTPERRGGDQRKVERRRPRRGVNVRVDDDPNYTPKRVWRGKK